MPYLEGKALLQEVKKWATPEEFEMAAYAIADDVEWINGHTYLYPADLLLAYGQKVSENPAEELRDLLKESHGWGELLGAVLASFGSWKKEQQKIIQAELAAALKSAAEDGVSH
jgi:hypothetical protein